MDRDARAMQVYRASHATCEVCGWTRHVHIHHLLPLSSGGTNDEDNLVSLCANHHADAHAEISAFVECDEDGSYRLVLTRYGVIQHLKKLDKSNVDMFRKHVAAARNQQWAALTPDEQASAVQSALAQAQLSDHEAMMLYEIRRGSLKVVPASSEQRSERFQEIHPCLIQNAAVARR